MIRIVVEGSSTDEVKTALAEVLAAFGEAPGKPTGGATTKPKDTAAEDDDVSGGITYEEVSALVVRLSKEKGRDDAVNFLKSFKGANGKPATKGAEIQPKDYPAAKEKAEALLEEVDLG